MSNWFKKKLQQLSDKINADEMQDTPANANVDGQTAKKINVNTGVDNVEELKEVIIGAITSAIKMLGYGKSTITGFVFHSKYADNAVENIAMHALTKDTEFVKQIKRMLKSRAVPFKDDLAVSVAYNSELTEKLTRVMDGIGVEVLIPGESLRPIKGRVIATEGITWEPEYLLEPTGKTYFIGRCKDPKIDNGPKIHNDIAFVGIEEVDEDRYIINNHISRAHAQIIFDKEIGAFKIYRSRFLNNPAHKIKIYNAGRNDFAGVSLNQSTVPHVLKDGDSICFNDKIVLEFYIMGL